MMRNRPTKAKSGRAPSTGRAAAPPVLPHGTEDFPVIGIGASAGGLEACTKLLGALPPDNGMAFVLVQHLDPTHDSMMADHLYIIPPGAYLSVNNGALHLSEPEARHGARLPFDFLLRSLAEGYEERAICVILSGTGADGSLGLKAVKEKGGLVIAQDPDELIEAADPHAVDGRHDPSEGIRVADRELARKERRGDHDEFPALRRRPVERRGQQRAVDQADRTGEVRVLQERQELPGHLGEHERPVDEVRRVPSVEVLHERVPPGID
ncbi:MAG: hypothetical protein B7Z81_16155, partial [Acidocella sp. 20-61-6]